MQKVNVLFEGYSFEENGLMRANCTSTLVQTTSGLNIVVDTMTAWDGDKIKDALSKFGLKVEDIHFLACTHGHSDHIGCNYLFQNAKWHFVGACVSQRDRYLFDWKDPDKFELDGSNVVVERTPGHTLSCVSVVVRNSQLGTTVGICGDLFECKEDIFDSSIWIEAGSEDASSQIKQRLRMAKLCDYIIPGHGPGFHVTEEMRCALQKEFETDSDAAGRYSLIVKCAAFKKKFLISSRLEIQHTSNKY